VDDGGARLLVLGLGDPHGLESREGRKNGPSNPDQKLSLGRRHHLDLHGRWRKRSHFLAEPLRNSGVHGGSARHHDVAVEVLPDIDVALEDRLVADLVEPGHLLADEHRLEESLRASEPLRTDLDGLTVRQLVDLVVLGGAVVG